VLHRDRLALVLKHALDCHVPSAHAVDDAARSVRSRSWRRGTLFPAAVLIPRRRTQRSSRGAEGGAGRHGGCTQSAGESLVLLESLREGVSQYGQSRQPSRAADPEEARLRRRPPTPWPMISRSPSHHGCGGE
jgi:hypothetical protein